jgi:hypothetical protein
MPAQFGVSGPWREDLMGSGKFIAAPLLALLITIPPALHAQDVPGIEICTVEKAMDRRTSCLQSNIDFLQKTITKQSADHQLKLDAANRQIEALKATIAGLQKVIVDLQTAQKQMAEDMKKSEPAKGATAPGAKEGNKEGTKENSK